MMNVNDPIGRLASRIIDVSFCCLLIHCKMIEELVVKTSLHHLMQ